MEDERYQNLLDRMEGMKVRTLERYPDVVGLPQEPVTTGDCQQGRTTHDDPGRELYTERSTYLAGFFMPPALPWEDLSAQDRERWRGYARTRG